MDGQRTTKHALPPALGGLEHKQANDVSSIGVKAELVARRVAAPTRRIDLFTKVFHVAEVVAAMALANRGSGIETEAPVKKPQIVLRVFLDRETADYIDAIAVLEGVQEFVERRGHDRQWKRLAVDGRHRTSCRFGHRQGVVEIVNLTLVQMVNPLSVVLEVLREPRRGIIDR